MSQSQFGSAEQSCESTGRAAYQPYREYDLPDSTGGCLQCARFQSQKRQVIPFKQLQSPICKISKGWARNYDIKVLVNPHALDLMDIYDAL